MSLNALVLLSGGMDSTTLLYEIWTTDFYNEVYAIIFDYGQKHMKEVTSAIAVADKLKIPWKLRHLDLGGDTPLTNLDMKVPTQDEKQQATTVVPYRNALFLLHACIRANQLKCSHIFHGACKDDQENYPDCRPEFFRNFESMIHIQQDDVNVKYPYSIMYPFTKIDKKEIVRQGLRLEVPYELTWSCYEGRVKACGVCDACWERLLAFRKNNAKDPIEYERP